jgi:hypothetical protein
LLARVSAASSSSLNVSSLRDLRPQLLSLLVHQVQGRAVCSQQAGHLLQHALDERHQTQLAAHRLGDLQQRGLLPVGVGQLAQDAVGVRRAQLAEGLAGLVLVEALLLDLVEELRDGRGQGCGGRLRFRHEIGPPVEARILHPPNRCQPRQRSFSAWLGRAFALGRFRLEGGPRLADVHAVHPQASNGATRVREPIIEPRP